MAKERQRQAFETALSVEVQKNDGKSVYGTNETIAEAQKALKEQKM